MRIIVNRKVILQSQTQSSLQDAVVCSSVVGEGSAPRSLSSSAGLTSVGGAGQSAGQAVRHTTVTRTVCQPVGPAAAGSFNALPCLMSPHTSHVSSHQSWM
eukprot:Selendium_serpulae@DN1266_c0_g1_i1.p2